MTPGRRRAAGVGSARSFWEAIGAGMVIFRCEGDTWHIVGSTNLIVPGAEVTVTKSDRTTTRVLVCEVTAEGPHDGIATRTAMFVPLNRSGHCVESV